MGSITLLALLVFVTPVINAQTDGLVSKNPPVVWAFDPATNKTTITGLMFNPADNLGAMFPPYGRYAPPDLQLHRVEYSYPGQTPSRPETVDFLLAPSSKHKVAPNFSVTADDQVLYEGEAVLNELCCAEINGVKSNPQFIVVTLPSEALKRLSQSKKIELKVASKKGKYSVKLNDYQRKVLAAMVPAQ